MLYLFHFACVYCYTDLILHIFIRELMYLLYMIFIAHGIVLTQLHSLSVGT